MKKILLTNGDSWTFGSEIVAPEFFTKPMNSQGQYILKPGFCEVHSENDYFRVPRIWPTFLGNLLNTEIINLAYPGRSNDLIYDTTISWLIENYIKLNKSTSELVVVVGWSSPERTSIIYNDYCHNTVAMDTIWPMFLDAPKQYVSRTMKEIFKFYVSNLWVEQEYIKRYVEQTYNLYLFCNKHNIDLFMFNSFYEVVGGPTNWNTTSIKECIEKWEINKYRMYGDNYYDWKKEGSQLLFKWEDIPNEQFILKDKETFNTFIHKNIKNDNIMNNWHPSPSSHKRWADCLFFHIMNYIRC